MSFKYQSLLGDASIDADAVITSELDADTANISSLKVTTTSSGVLTTNTLKLPTNAALDNVLTCVNLNGTVAWRPPVDVNLAGDAVGIAGGNRVDTLAGGTILVSNLVTLAGTQTLINKTFTNAVVNNTIASASSSGLSLSSTGGTYGASKVTIQNIGGCNGMLLDTTGASVALTDVVCKTGTLSMNLRFEARGASLLNSANTTYGENQILLNNSLTAAAYFGTVSSGVTGYFNAPSGVWTGKITCPNVDVRKRMVLWEGGTWTDYSDHRFTGLGKIGSAMLFSSVATSDDFVLTAATSASASNELFRIKGTGTVLCPNLLQTSTLKVTTGAALGSVLTSDASGNASWLAPAVVTDVGNLTMSGYLFNPAGRYLLANKSATSSLFLGEGGNTTANGLNNVICGPSAYNMTSAAYTTAIGTSVSPNLSTAFYTTAAGYQSLPTLTTGNSNTAIGVDAGRGITDGANNTFLGQGTNATVGSISGSTAVGSGAFLTTSNTVQLGGSNVTNVNTYGNINAPGITTTISAAINYNSGGYRAPTTQGTYFTWNRTGGDGRACWGNPNAVLGMVDMSGLIMILDPV